MSNAYIETISFDNTVVTTIFASSSFTSLPSYLPVIFPPPKVRYRASFTGDSTSLISKIVVMWRLLRNTTQINTYGDPSSISSLGSSFGQIAPLYIADFSNNRIISMTDMSGTNWTTFGSLGSGVNQFNGPSTIVLDSSGKIYITDFYNNRIVRMDDMTGTNWTTFGSLGSGINQFNHPAAIALDANGRIYVVEYTGNKIDRFDDMNGTNWTTLSTVAGTPLSNPGAVFVDSNFKIYIADSVNKRITRTDDMLGTNGVAFTSANLRLVAGVYVDLNFKIYLCSSSATFSPGNLVGRLDDMTGTNYVEFGTGGSGVNQFKGAASVKVNTKGEIYVADSVLNRVVRFSDMSGSNWTTFGSLGSGINQLNTPQDII